MVENNHILVISINNNNNKVTLVIGDCDKEKPTLVDKQERKPSVTSRQTGSRLSLKYQKEAVFFWDTNNNKKRNNKKVTIGFSQYLENQIHSKARFDGVGKLIERR